MPGKFKGLSCKEDALNPQQADDLLSVCVSVRDRFIIGCLPRGELSGSVLFPARPFQLSPGGLRLVKYSLSTRVKGEIFSSHNHSDRESAMVAAG